MVEKRSVRTNWVLGGLMALLGAGGCMPSLRYDTAAPSMRERAEPSKLPGATWIDVPVTVHYATREGMTTVTPQRATDSVQRANLALMPYGIRLFVSETNILPQGYARVDDDDDRFALAELSHRNGTIHVFFVEGVKLAAPKRKSSRVSGMHWRYRGLQTPMHRREYIVVAQDAPDTTLAHEIGHVLGLGHTDAPGNLMCSCRRDGVTSFTEDQGRKMRSGARLLLLRATP